MRTRYQTRNILYSSIAYHTRSRNRRLFTNGIPKKKRRNNRLWVSATKTRNFMLKDCLVDWLKLVKNKGKNKGKNNMRNNEFTGFSRFIIDKGNEFEDELVKYIDTNIFPVVKVADGKDACVKVNFEKTKKLMLDGTPIIHSAPVRTKNNTGGIIDLLVRSDYLKYLVEDNPLSAEYETKKAPNLQGDYHYTVIDIKFSTLPLRADGIHLLNSDSFPAYKVQTYIYTQAVGEIQGYESRYAFILGRRWRYTSKKTTFKEFNCLDKLGVIDYENIDADYKNMTKDAVKWVRDLKNDGEKWTVNPPSRTELYPNMCKDSGIWNKEKAKIAKNIGDITQLWYCGVKNRDVALKNGIRSWKDEDCNSSKIGQNGSRGLVIDKIININKQKTDKIYPVIIENNIYKWKSREENELFVDFETMGDVFAGFDQLPRQPCTEIIFMIGVSWVENDKVVYKSFICNENTLAEEFRIMNEFNIFTEEKGYPPLYFWHAEKVFWERAENRQMERRDISEEQTRIISDNWKINDWRDLANVFRTEPIVIKDCFNFGLKDISKSMRKFGMIKSKIESKCNSGMDAMVGAYQCYRDYENPSTCTLMKDIEKYNKFDCEVLQEIIEYLRNNHT